MDTLTAQPELVIPDQTEHRVMSATEARALELLGDGHSQDIVATTLGVTASRVSQLMAQDWFKEEVVKRRYSRQQEANLVDAKINRLEDKILDKLEKSLPLISRSGELIKAFSVLNSAKRRGSQSDPNQTLINQTVVNLTVPVALVNKYKTDSNSQVIEVNDKPFLTAPSNILPNIASTVLEQTKEEQQHAMEQIAQQFSVPINVKGQAVSAEDL